MRRGDHHPRLYARFVNPWVLLARIGVAYDLGADERIGVGAEIFARGAIDVMDWVGAVPGPSGVLDYAIVFIRISFAREPIPAILRLSLEFSMSIGS
jgi:hypothetical protein